MKLSRLLKIASPNRDWFPIRPIGEAGPASNGVHVVLTRKEWGEHMSLLKYYRARIAHLEKSLAELMDHAAKIGEEA